MSVACGAECVLGVGFTRWAWKRCTHAGSDDSAAWPTVSSADEFEPVPRACRAILAVYEDDLAHPRWAPPGVGYGLDPACVVKRADYSDTGGAAPPYLIYVDHCHREIILALRGLNLARESDYKLLLDNRLGRQVFHGGYVHHGLLKSAVWVLKREWETLRELWRETGCCYKLVFAGHSLGSGVAALMTVLAVNRLDKLGGIPRDLVRCYAVAPARCMSLNLAVKYADVIHSVVLQRTDIELASELQHIGPHEEVWKAPPSGCCLKVNFDGALFANKGKCGLRVCVRDDAGNILSCYSEPGGPYHNPLDAGLKAVCKAMEVASRLNSHQIEIEGDSLDVINGLNEGSNFGSVYGAQAGAAFKSLSSIKAAKSIHVRRGSNGVAHALARFAQVLDSPKAWIIEIPLFVLLAMGRDRIQF